MTPYDYCLLAQEAYNAPPDIGLANSASRAIVRDTPAGLCVAFRGSDDIASWITDFDAEVTNVPGVGAFHKGFWLAWGAISLATLIAIAGRPVILVGHSLGAALAIAAACDMTVSGNPPAAVYAFEPPRVSPDPAIADVLAAVHLQLYRNGEDIVPELPPLWHHVGAVTPIGAASGPIADHLIERVLSALSVDKQP